MTLSLVNSDVLRKELSRSCIFVLIFLYFFTTSADLLQIEISLFHCKLNHALGFLLFLAISFGQKKWILPEKKILGFFFATVIAMIISGSVGAYPYRSLMYLIVYIFTFCIYFLLPFHLLITYGKESIFKLYFAAFVATGGVAVLQFTLSLVGIAAPFVTQFVLEKIARGQAMAYEPSYFALFMVPYVMHANTRFLFDSECMMNIPKLITLMGKNCLLLVSTSTGAFFSYFIFFLMIVGTSRLSWVRGCHRKINRKLLKISCLFTCFFACMALVVPQLFRASFWKFFVLGFMSHGSFVQRWEGIVATWEIFLDHPLIGVGVGGVGPALYQKLFFDGRRLGKFYEPFADMFEFYDPTNVFLELLGSLGILGLIVFIGFGFVYFHYLLQIGRIKNLPQEEKSMCYGLLVSISVMLVVLQFNQNLFRSYVWVHLAMCLGYFFATRLQYEQ